MPTQPKAAEEAKAGPVKDGDADKAARDANEQVVDSGKKAALEALDQYETNMNSFADQQEKVAEEQEKTADAQAEWVASAARAQAKLTRGMTEVYVNTMRDLLK